MKLIKFHTGGCSPVQFIIECTMNVGHTVGVVCLEGFDQSTVSTVNLNHVTFRILIVEFFVNNLVISWIVSIKSCFKLPTEATPAVATADQASLKVSGSYH